MPLQFNVYIVAAEKLAELPHALRRGLHSSVGQRLCERTFLASRKTDQSSGVRGGFFMGNVAFVSCARAISCA